ncbi:MAG: hypothetical protein LUH82_01840 [Clostridiales bacterium]|nr:hypothetical protein [Clostridiales bacterium]
MSNISLILIASAVLVAATNVITQVLKGFVSGEKPRRALTIAVSVVLTYLALLIYSAIWPLTEWYIWFPGGLVGGVVIAYGAMYGYDNLYANLLSKLGSTTNE